MNNDHYMYWVLEVHIFAVIISHVMILTIFQYKEKYERGMCKNLRNKITFSRANVTWFLHQYPGRVGATGLFGLLGTSSLDVIQVIT